MILTIYLSIGFLTSVYFLTALWYQGENIDVRDIGNSILVCFCWPILWIVFMYFSFNWRKVVVKGRNKKDKEVINGGL
jgi:hypothetical protein